MPQTEGLIHRIADRPESKRGGKISGEFAKHLIKRVRNFVKWLHRTPEFGWKRPPGWETSQVRIDVTPQERQRAFRPQTYTVEELKTI